MTRRKSRDQLLIDLALADIEVRKAYKEWNSGRRAYYLWKVLCLARRRKGAARRACLMAGRRLLKGDVTR